MDNDKAYINHNISYLNSIAKIAQNADSYCKQLGRGICAIDLPKFPSKKYSAGNFKYILSDIIHNRT